MQEKDFTIKGPIKIKYDKSYLSSRPDEKWVVCIESDERLIPVTFFGEDVQTVKAIPIDQNVRVDVGIKAFQYENKSTRKINHGVELVGIGIYYDN